MSPLTSEIIIMSAVSSFRTHAERFSQRCIARSRSRRGRSFQLEVARLESRRLLNVGSIEQTAPAFVAQDIAIGRITMIEDSSRASHGHSHHERHHNTHRPERRHHHGGSMPPTGSHAGNGSPTGPGAPSGDSYYIIWVLGPLLSDYDNIYAGVAFPPFNIAEFSASDQNGPVSNPGDFTAIILWGDGTTSQGQVVNYEEGGYVYPTEFVVLGSHVYAQPGEFNIQVQIVQASGYSENNAIVNNAIVTTAP